MDLDTYTLCSKVHTDKNTTIDWARVKQIERQASTLTKGLAKMLGLGTDGANKKCWEIALKVVDAKPPNLQLPSQGS